MDGIGVKELAPLGAGKIIFVLHGIRPWYCAISRLAACSAEIKYGHGVVVLIPVGVHDDQVMLSVNKPEEEYTDFKPEI